MRGDVGFSGGTKRKGEGTCMHECVICSFEQQSCSTSMQYFHAVLPCSTSIWLWPYTSLKCWPAPPLKNCCGCAQVLVLTLEKAFKSVAPKFDYWRSILPGQVCFLCCCCCYIHCLQRELSLSVFKNCINS